MAAMNDKVQKTLRDFAKSLRKDFKSLFLTGLLVIVPLWLTYLVMKFMVGIMDSVLLILPASWRPESILGFHIPGLGIVFTIFLIVVVGFFARNFIGRRLVRYGESLIARIPLVRNLYKGFRQFTYALLGGNKDQFQRAILFEYPRKDIWSIGFVTNRVAGVNFADKVPKDSLCVFIPTTPNPTSGWFLMIPESDTIPLDMGVDVAFKIIISGGVILPGVKTEPKEKSETGGS